MIYDDENTNDEKVAFNFGKFKSMYLANLLMSATDKFRSGNIQGWYNDLRAIKNKVSGRLTKKQLQKLRTYEGCIGKIMNNKVGYSNGMSLSQVIKHNRDVDNILSTWIEEYEMIVMKYLDNMGYDNPTKVDESKMVDD